MTCVICKPPSRLIRNLRVTTHGPPCRPPGRVRRAQRTSRHSVARYRSKAFFQRFRGSSNTTASGLKAVRIVGTARPLNHRRVLGMVGITNRFEKLHVRVHPATILRWTSAGAGNTPRVRVR